MFLLYPYFLSPSLSFSISLLKLDTCTLCLRPARGLGIVPVTFGVAEARRPEKEKNTFLIFSPLYIITSLKTTGSLCYHKILLLVWIVSDGWIGLLRWLITDNNVTVNNKHICFHTVLDISINYTKEKKG